MGGGREIRPRSAFYCNMRPQIKKHFRIRSTRAAWACRAVLPAPRLAPTFPAFDPASAPPAPQGPGTMHTIRNGSHLGGESRAHLAPKSTPSLASGRGGARRRASTVSQLSAAQCAWSCACSADSPSSSWSCPQCSSCTCPCSFTPSSCSCFALVARPHFANDAVLI